VFIFFIIELGSRRVMHFRVTRYPTDAWVAQMERSAVLREATPFGEKPRFLIRDNDSKYGALFTQVAVGSGIEVLRTPYRAPKANATFERFLGTVNRECVDHILILGERYIQGIIKEFIQYYNSARPHQGIGQAIPEVERSDVLPNPSVAGGANAGADAKITSLLVLGGLHHDYQRAA
jgi:putative transposase